MVDLSVTSRSVATQTHITGPIQQVDDRIPGEIDTDLLEGYTNKQLQTWLRERSWSTRGNKKELVEHIWHAITVDGVTESAGSACAHTTVRAGANATHAWRKCVQCGKVVWKLNKTTKTVELQESFA
eukprot:5400602-Amphidinium_carterae.1